MGDLPHKRNRYLTRFQELWRLREHKVVENKSTKTVLTHLYIKNDLQHSEDQAGRHRGKHRPQHLILLTSF